MTMPALKPQSQTIQIDSNAFMQPCANIQPGANKQPCMGNTKPGYRYPLSKPKTNTFRVAEPNRPYENFQQLKFIAVTTVAREQAKHIASSIKHGSSKPCLQLSGKWLEKAGFGEDTRCLVEVYKGMLVVTPDE